MSYAAYLEQKRIAQEEILNKLIAENRLMPEDTLFYTTPLANLEPEGRMRAMMIDDMVKTELYKIKENEKSTSSEMTEEERIHHNKHLAPDGKRNFW